MNIKIYKKKKLSRLFPQILKAINSDLKNVTALTHSKHCKVSFFGLVREAQDYMNKIAEEKIMQEGVILQEKKLKSFYQQGLRIEGGRDAKLRTFITDDSNRDELVKHVYDVTYGSIKNVIT